MNFDQIAQLASKIIAAAAPIAETVAPGEAAAIELGASVLTGLANAEPTAVALVKQIQSGTDATPAQLAEAYANYTKKDDALAASIDAHIKAG